MAERPDSATVQLKVRMKESLRQNVERSAKAQGISLNADIVRRLEDSFMPAEKLFDDPMLTFVAQLVGSSFATAGQLAAERLGHPKWTASRWMQHPDAFQAGLQAAFMTLASFDPSSKEQPIDLNRLEKLAEHLAKYETEEGRADEYERVPHGTMDYLLGRVSEGDRRAWSLIETFYAALADAGDSDAARTLESLRSAVAEIESDHEMEARRA